jgi:hypothetical protein
LDQGLHRIGLYAVDVLAKALIEFSEEVLDEQRNVGRSLAQGGQPDRDDVQSIK